MRRFGTIAALFAVSMAGLMLGVVKTPVAKSASLGANSLPDIIFVEAPVVASAELLARFPQGSRLVRLKEGTAPNSVNNLTRGFFAAADPQVSFDSSKVLFSARRTRGARWQVWEMSADGGGKRQITDCSGDCLRAAFLPRDQIVYTVVVGKGASRISEVYISEANGDDAHPITFGPGDFQVETVLQSGRILVSAASELIDNSIHSPSRVFYSLRPDGSGLSMFRWDGQSEVVRSAAEELDDGTILFTKRVGTGERQGGGQLALIRPGEFHNSVITPPNAAYSSAHVLDGNALVVSMRKSGSTSRSNRFSLYTFDLTTRTVTRRIYSNPEFSSVQAVPLEPRPAPRYYWSILHPDRNYGRVICLDSYLSAGSPGGRLTAHIARVRVIALQPDHHSERTLGEAPVESDGSFYIKVPADQSIRFELLDARGAVVRAQRSWIWARTGEDVGCVGCHESKTIVPSDHWPLALKRFDTPVSVGVSGRLQPAGH